MNVLGLEFRHWTGKGRTKRKNSPMSGVEIDDENAVTKATQQPDKTGDKPAKSGKKKLTGRLKSFVPTFKEGVIGLLVLNAAVTGALWWKVETNKPPVIATVGVSSLTRMFIQKVGSDPNASPEAIQLKTTMFQDVIRKKVAELATKKGVIIIAREAVLTGESVDLTPQIQEAVNESLKDAPSGVAEQKGGLDADLLK